MPDDSRKSRPASLLKQFSSLELVLLVGGVALFIVLLYDMLVLEEFLSPPLIALAAVILLWPLRQTQAARALFFSGGFLIVLWFLDELSTVLIPFVLVYLLAFLFDPVVTTVHRRYNVPRWISSLVVTIFELIS